MKKLMFIILLTTIYSLHADAKPGKFYIYIGAVSKDGTGLNSPIGSVTWGGGCKDGIGICFEAAIMNQNTGEENVEIFEDLTMQIEVTHDSNLAKLIEFSENNQYIVGEDSPVNNSVIEYFDFLDKQSKYIIRKGNYEITEVNNIKVINLKIEKI